MSDEIKKPSISFSLMNESDEPETIDSDVHDFSSEGLLETLSVLSETIAQSQQLYGQAIENMETRLQRVEIDLSKIVALLKMTVLKDLTLIKKPADGTPDDQAQ